MLLNQFIILSFKTNQKISEKEEENIKRYEDDYIQKIVAGLDDHDEKSKLESFNDNKLKLNGIVGLINKLLKENSQLKTEMKKDQKKELDKKLKINNNNSFSILNVNDNYSFGEQINIKNDNKLKPNDKLAANDSVNQDIQSFFNINKIGFKFEPDRRNSDDNSNKEINVSEDYEFSLCDNFLHNKNFFC